MSDSDRGEKRDEKEMTEERDTRLDEALSALRDGELSPREQADLSRRVDTEPALRERVEAFEAVDRALEGLSSREIPADLGERLRARIDRDPFAPRVRLRDGDRRSAGPRRRRRSWAAVGAGLAAAAALALYLALPTPGPRAPLPGFDSLAPSDPSDVVLVERAPSRVDPVALAEPVLADPLGFQDASEEEVAIAFHYETLADLEMIEELEMLELLAALDDGGPRG
ncbi:MAG: hypothetical protein VX574_04490 [Myxococcota bacterium]|nr:hypothetical protein [Myxococcota bacterium]